MSRPAQILWLVFSMVSGSAFAQTEIRWAPDLATARRAAAQFQVPMLIHFYGDNCLPCKTLEQRVLNQDSVIKTLNKYFICVRINASQDRPTAAEYQVHSWPTDVFVSADGQVLYQGVCKQDISGYMEVLQSVAVSNRDRNTMVAEARSKQSPTQNPSAQNQPLQNQLAAGAGSSQSNSSSSSLPPLAAQSSNTAFAAPPAIAASTPATQFQVAPPTRTGMMDSSAGLPPLAAHLASRPLGKDGYGASSNVAGQMNAQANLPAVSARTNSTPNQAVSNTTATLVSNPYFPESEDMVCTPDGKCGPASCMAQTGALGTNQLMTSNQQFPVQNTVMQNGSAQNKPLHTATNATQSPGPQFPPLSINSVAINAAATTPTFQPKSAMLVANSKIIPSDASSQPANEAKFGLIESAPLQELEPAAYNGFCPIALVKSGLKVQGKTLHAVRHRGRTYLMESPEAVKEFVQAPDRYSPVLSGYDPMIFLETGKLVDGALEHALYDPNSGTIILFASADSQTKFKADPTRNTKALGFILNAANKK